MLQNKTIIVGVTGGIAAYKTCEVVSKLKKLGAQVWVVMTKEATQLVSPLTFKTLSQNPVITDLFSKKLAKLPVPHINLAKQADLVLVAPATANILGKLAQGVADDPLTTILLATTACKLIAPAMNNEMWKNPIVTKNVAGLKKQGFLFIGPEEGKLACGDEDIGRMSEPAEIIAKVMEILIPRQDLKGRHFLITAGGTREKIDPVRYIANYSSGKMGYALAAAARARGAEVTLISANVALPSPLDLVPVKVSSAQEMLDAVLAAYEKAEVIIMAAAVADYTVKTQKLKIKKSKKTRTLKMEPTVDIIKTLARQKDRREKIMIGFALETDHLIKNAKKKLADKKLDLIVANGSETFQGDKIAFAIIDRQGKTQTFPPQLKPLAAQRILDQAKTLLHVR